MMIALLAAAPAPAQDQRPDPERRRPTERRQQAEPADAEDRAARRAWLSRRLEESRAEQARLQDMLAKLDAGEPLPDLRRPPHDGRDDRAGAAGRDGRPGDRLDPERPDPSVDERARLVAQFAREHFPEFAERLESERQRDPDAAHRIAARFWPRIVELKEIEKTDPELFTVEVDRLRSGEAIMNAVRRARSARPLDDDARQRLIAHLRQLAERHFELRLEAIRLRLESLRRSVRDTERELEERRADRERNVEEQVQRLLRAIEHDRQDDGRRQDQPRRGG
jgi:hypothetical protein